MDQAPGSQFLQPCVEGSSEVERQGWADKSSRSTRLERVPHLGHISSHLGALAIFTLSGVLRISWISGLISFIILDSLAPPPLVGTGELPTALACTGFQG